MIDLVTELVTKTLVIEVKEPPTRQVITETSTNLPTNVVEVLTITHNII